MRAVCEKMRACVRVRVRVRVRACVRWGVLLELAEVLVLDDGKNELLILLQQLRADMCADMCVDTRIDICVDICVDVCI